MDLRPANSSGDSSPAGTRSLGKVCQRRVCALTRWPAGSGGFAAFFNAGRAIWKFQTPLFIYSLIAAIFACCQDAASVQSAQPAFSTASRSVAPRPRRPWAVIQRPRRLCRSARWHPRARARDAAPSWRPWAVIQRPRRLCGSAGGRWHRRARARDAAPSWRPWAVIQRPRRLCRGARWHQRARSRDAAPSWRPWVVIQRPRRLCRGAR